MAKSGNRAESFSEVDKLFFQFGLKNLNSHELGTLMLYFTTSASV